MKKEICLLLILMIIPLSSASLIINEVLPNPAIDWNSNTLNETYHDEWIELFNSGSEILLDDFIIGDKVKNYSLGNRTLCSNCYLVLFGNTTSLQLNNNDENIFLYKNNSLVENFSYSTSQKDVSLCKCNGIWKECNATLNSENLCTTEINNTNTTQNTTENTTTESQQNISDSYIKIISAPENSDFGDIIEVNVEAYRGDSAKYAVYTYIKNSNGEVVSEKLSTHIDSKYTNLTFTASLKIRSNCDNNYDEGSYLIVSEGIDTITTKEVYIYENPNCESNIAEYSVKIPEFLELNKEFEIEIRIKNKDNKQLDFSAWSYVYKSSACYSCELNREENKDYISIDSHDIKTLILKDKIISEIEKGNYSLKVRIQEESKNYEDFTYSIEVRNSNLSEKENILNSESEITTPITTGKVVFNSKESFQKKIAYILSAMLILLVGYIIYKKKELKKAENFENSEEFDEDEF